jgi:hypothetical protein
LISFSAEDVGVSGSSTNNYGVLGTSVHAKGIKGESTNDSGVYGESTNAQGVYGDSLYSIGVEGTSTDGYGILGASINSSAGYFFVNPAANSTVTEILHLTKGTSNVANGANGIGGAANWYVESNAGNSPYSASIAALLTDVSDGAEVSALVFYTKAAISAPAETIRLSSIALVPTINNTVDLGLTGQRWKDLWVGAITGTSVTDSGLTATRIPYAGVGGLLTDSSALFYNGTNQLNLGAGATAETAYGLIINPSGNLTAQLKLISTGGAGSQIMLGANNVTGMNLGFNQLYTNAFELNTGSGYAYSTEFFTVHTTVGVGHKGVVGTILAGITTGINGTKTSGGSIPDGTHYYLVTCVDYAGTETTRSRSTVSAAKSRTGSNDSLIVLTWTAVQGAVSYKIYRNTDGSNWTDKYLGTSTTATYTDTAAAPSAGSPPHFVFGSFGSALSPTGTSWIGGALYVTGLSTLTGGSVTGDGTNKVSVSSTGDQTFAGSAGFYPRRVSQNTEPANGTGATQIDVGELIIWNDADGGEYWLLYNDTAGGVRGIKIE